MAWFDEFGGNIADAGGPGVGSGGFNALDAQATPKSPDSLFGSSAVGSNPDFANLTKPTDNSFMGTGFSGKQVATGAGAAVAGGALAYNLMQGDKDVAGVMSLRQLVAGMEPEKAALFAQGNQYMHYLGEGTLPPGMEAIVQQNMLAGKARFLQNAASSGLSADPTKNSALAQDLNSLDSRAAMERTQMGTQLLSAGNQMISSGIQIGNLDANIFKYLADADLKKSQATGSAISAFAAALGTIGGAAIGGPAGAMAGGAAGKAAGSLLG